MKRTVLLAIALGMPASFVAACLCYVAGIHLVSRPATAVDIRSTPDGGSTLVVAESLAKNGVVRTGIGYRSVEVLDGARSSARAGFPFLALDVDAAYLPPGVNTWKQRLSSLVRDHGRVHWLPLFLGGLVWSVFLLFAYKGIRWGHAAYRISRGRCPSCAYQIRDERGVSRSSRCPECGADLRTS